jgi:hypothetical protein
VTLRETSEISELTKGPGNCYIRLMSDIVHNLTLDVLKQLQSGFSEMRERLERIEEINRKQRRDSAGMLVMMRATAGDFDARVTEIDGRMDAWDAKRS